MEGFEAILSPSKARQAASQAKDWAYVTNWLNRKYSPNRVPNFERNDDTLKALLNIAAANDTADEEEALIHRAREETIGLLKATEAERSPDPTLALLEDIEDELDDKSNKLLQDMAETAVLLGIPTGDLANLDRSILNLTREEFNATEQLQKLETLQLYLKREIATLHEQLEELKDDRKYETPPDLPAKTSEWVRNKKTVDAKAKEYQSRIMAWAKLPEIGKPRIEDLMIEEEGVVRIREKVKSLENTVSTFHGLPSNIVDAKSEYQKLENELHALIRQRDQLFEGLVGRSNR
ncbi:predicted protein [Uncinocarpus reesii 1704]|uniref:Uncharacterized protein n=1 Tax=Uncinocarpus reesii (strain UAMH 1704) TaxID=336963 RepID=C4JSL4_UNCRE|nr:uncharacterized protein UREG_05453 [Uncinocarpus reesii 1704]EEP80611.1 predicted protein [Uncinocarpus reesii 1704]